MLPDGTEVPSGTKLRSLPQFLKQKRILVELTNRRNLDLIDSPFYLFDLPTSDQTANKDQRLFIERQPSVLCKSCYLPLSHL